MITIVSGLPRSGTSLMMQMLAAGGMPILCDDERQADVDNPRGYLEWDRVKQLPTDPACIAQAEGHAVKVISRLLLSLPEGHEYRVVFMQRPLPEILASQDVMLRHRGKLNPKADSSAIAGALESHLREVLAWLNSKSYARTLYVPYHDVLRNGEDIGQKLTRFLEIELNTKAMTSQIDSTLYRNRKA
jgi:hypothetical protein